MDRRRFFRLLAGTALAPKVLERLWDIPRIVVMKYRQPGPSTMGLTAMQENYRQMLIDDLLRPNPLWERLRAKTPTTIDGGQRIASPVRYTW